MYIINLAGNVRLAFNVFFFCEHGQPSHLAASMEYCLELDSKISSCASFVPMRA